MAQTYPYRHKLTGKVQLLSEGAASVFPDLLERLPDDWEAREAAVAEAQEHLEAALETGSERTKDAKQAKAELDAAQQAAAETVPTDAETSKES